MRMREGVEGRQGHLKRGDVPAGLGQRRQRLGKLCVWHEGIEQGDVRHPALHVAVMLTPDGLNGLPDVRWWHGHYRRVMGLRWHMSGLKPAAPGPRERPAAVCL